MGSVLNGAGQSVGGGATGPVVAGGGVLGSLLLQFIGLLVGA
jgi:hypothetical protein